MKTNIFFIPFLLFIGIACNQEKAMKYPPISALQEPEKGEAAIVEGKILNLQVYPHINEVTLTLPDFSVTGEMHVSPIDSSGEFRFTIYPMVPREFSLTPIEDKLLIAPGNTLYIEHDFSDITNSRFSGSAAEVNRQIAQFRNRYLGRFNFPYDLPYLEYKDACDKQVQETVEKLSLFQKEFNTSELFNRWAEKQIRLDYYRALFFFPLQHFLRTQEDFTEQDTYYAFLPEFEKTIDETMILSSYYDVMNRYILLKRMGSDPIPKESKVALSITETLKLFQDLPDNPFFSQFAIATHLGFSTKANMTQEIEENEEQLNKQITHPFLRAALQKEYNRIKAYKANPTIYSDAVMGRNLLERSGAGVHPQDSFNIVKQIIEKKPGQVLYVDIWAPWCGPCIRQMPDSKKLSDYFSDQPVTFVYLNIGGTDQQWKETINKYELSGIHIYLTDKEWQDVTKRFNARGIPYYLLFNKEGAMVDFGHHLLPSFPETKAAIEKLLNQ
jgi:thiol-disulfide isomerase/thioredoxin